jgi:hypothetical protein
MVCEDERRRTHFLEASHRKDTMASSLFTLLLWSIFFSTSNAEAPDFLVWPISLPNFDSALRNLSSLDDCLVLCVSAYKDFV